MLQLIETILLLFLQGIKPHVINQNNKEGTNCQLSNYERTSSESSIN